MKTIGIIAEYNPFHNGHKYLIDSCKKALDADNVVVLMSGDFVQRGTPSFVEKYAKAQMALCNGADIVFELPVYYSTGSAEFFASGAVRTLDRLGCIDYLCFGSETDDTSLLSDIAEILVKEPTDYKKTLSSSLKKGNSFAKARQEALLEHFSAHKTKFTKTDIIKAISSPNNILGIEYIKALKKAKSSIIPFSVKRIGQDYSSENFSEFSSATAIRSFISQNGISKGLDITMPSNCINLLEENQDKSYICQKFSDMMHYKLLMEKEKGFTSFLDVSEDLSNKICSNLEKYKDFDSFCGLLKSKDLTYSRISRSLVHIFLDITASNMEEYVKDDYTSFAKVLGMKKDSSVLLKEIQKNDKIAVLTNLKKAPSVCNKLEMRLLNETLRSSEIYGCLNAYGTVNEYRLKQIIL